MDLQAHTVYLNKYFFYVLQSQSAVILQVRGDTNVKYPQEPSDNNFDMIINACFKFAVPGIAARLFKYFKDCYAVRSPQFKLCQRYAKNTIKT